MASSFAADGCPALGAVPRGWHMPSVSTAGAVACGRHEVSEGGLGTSPHLPWPEPASFWPRQTLKYSPGISSLLRGDTSQNKTRGGGITAVLKAAQSAQSIQGTISLRLP